MSRLGTVNSELEPNLGIAVASLINEDGAPSAAGVQNSAGERSNNTLQLVTTEFTSSQKRRLSVAQSERRLG